MFLCICTGNRINKISEIDCLFILFKSKASCATARPLLYNTKVHFRYKRIIFKLKAY